MQYRLIIMRHAKSDWKTRATTDHQRPLNKRGREAAPSVGLRIFAAGWVPDLVLCSSAVRTRETWERMCQVFPVEIPVEYLDGLYLAGPASLSRALQEVPDTRRTVLALGHNPGWQEAVSDFSGRDVAMKTAYAALLAAEASSWVEASVLHGLWQLVEVIQPE